MPTTTTTSTPTPPMPEPITGRAAGHSEGGAPLLDVKGLRVEFPIRSGFLGRARGAVKAVDGVDFALAPGETLGLVGESGSGKTTIGRAVLQLIESTAGEVRFEGRDLRALGERELRAARRHMQIVFQDPFGSLNPRANVGAILGEPLRVHKLGASRAARRDMVLDLLHEVGLDPSVIDRYPHAFSGGQRQRIGIARALALAPKLVVLDEPVSALDVSIQAQILNLLARLREERGLAYLFIAHDLHVVEHLCHQVAVIYLGRIVERAPAGEIYRTPLHPYTRALLSAIPVPDPRRRGQKRIRLDGPMPSPANPPPGCRFHTRCPAAAADPDLMALCQSVDPPARELDTRHSVHCHLYGGDDGTPGPAAEQRQYPRAWDAIPTPAPGVSSTIGR